MWDRLQRCRIPFSSPKLIFRAALEEKVPRSVDACPCHQRPHGTRQALLRALRCVGSSGELRELVGTGTGVKPNKPNATDQQQPLTTQEAHGGSSPTNTPRANLVTVTGKKLDKVYSYVTTAIEMLPQGRHLLQLFTLEFYHKVHALHYFLD